MKIFLGGTCNNSKWREELIPLLEQEKIEYFNPVVDDWTPSCQELENKVKNQGDTIELYVITSEMTGVYSIAEAVQASNIKPDKTIFMVKEEGFSKGQLRSLNAVSDLIYNNHATIATNYRGIINAAKEQGRE